MPVGLCGRTAAAAAVVATDGHAGAVYELGGAPFTMTELAEVVSAAAGRTVRGGGRRQNPTTLSLSSRGTLTTKDTP